MVTDSRFVWRVLAVFYAAGILGVAIERRCPDFWVLPTFAVAAFLWAWVGAEWSRGIASRALAHELSPAGQQGVALAHAQIALRDALDLSGKRRDELVSVTAERERLVRLMDGGLFASAFHAPIPMAASVPAPDDDEEPEDTPLDPGNDEDGECLADRMDDMEKHVHGDPDDVNSQYLDRDVASLLLKAKVAEANIKHHDSRIDETRELVVAIGRRVRESLTTLHPDNLTAFRLSLAESVAMATDAGIAAKGELEKLRVGRDDFNARVTEVNNAAMERERRAFTRTDQRLLQLENLVREAGGSVAWPPRSPENPTAPVGGDGDLEERIQWLENTVNGVGATADTEATDGLADRLEAAEEHLALRRGVEELLVNRISELEKIMPVWAAFKPEQVGTTLKRMNEASAAIENLRSAARDTDRQVGALPDRIMGNIRAFHHDLMKRLVAVEQVCGALRDQSALAKPAPVPGTVPANLDHCIVVDKSGKSQL